VVVAVAVSMAKMTEVVVAQSAEMGVMVTVGVAAAVVKRTAVS